MARTDDDRRDFDEIRAALPNVSNAILRRSLRRLQDAKLVDEGYRNYFITEDGMIIVSEWSDTDYDDFALGVVVPEEDDSEDEEPSDDAQQLEDVWEPLPVDRSSPEYEQAVESLSDAVEKIEQDNGYADTHPEERNSIVFSLTLGVTLLKDHVMSYPQVQGLIIAPLNLNRIID